MPRLHRPDEDFVLLALDLKVVAARRGESDRFLKLQDAQ